MQVLLPAASCSGVQGRGQLFSSVPRPMMLAFGVWGLRFSNSSIEGLGLYVVVYRVLSSEQRFTGCICSLARLLSAASLCRNLRPLVPGCWKGFIMLLRFRKALMKSSGGYLFKQFMRV